MITFSFLWLPFLGLPFLGLPFLGLPRSRFRSYYPHLVKVNTEMQDRGGLIKNTVQKAGITDALSMEYLMHDNPFNL